MEIILTDGIRITTEVNQISPNIPDAWRVLVKFISDKPKKDRVIQRKNGSTEYFVFVSEEYLEDRLKVRGSSQEAERLASDHCRERFEKVGREVDNIQEDGWIFTDQSRGPLKGSINTFTGQYLDIIKR